MNAAPPDETGAVQPPPPQNRVRAVKREVDEVLAFNAALTPIGN